MLLAVTVIAEVLKALVTPPLSVAASAAVPSPTKVDPVFELAEVTVSTSVLAFPLVPRMLSVPLPVKPGVLFAPVTVTVGSPEIPMLLPLWSATPCRLRVVPASSVTAPVPRALLLATDRAPPETVVPPEYELLPDKVNAPVPTFTNEPVTASWDMVPAKVVVWLSEPTCKVGVVVNAKTTLEPDEPESDPTDNVPVVSTASVPPDVSDT